MSCDDCRRVTLCPLPDAQPSPLTCAICGKTGRVVPGCNYSLRDMDLFNELSQVVAESGVTPSEAQRLAGRVQSELGPASLAKQFEVLATRMPGLLPTQTAVGQNAVAQRRALIMLKTVLEGTGIVRPGN